MGFKNMLVVLSGFTKNDYFNRGIIMKQNTIPPFIFDMEYSASSFWGELIGIITIEQRDRLFRCNANLSFYIFNENNGKHSREHFHAFINKEKVASIFLDTFEIDYLNSKIKQSDKHKIVKWVEKNKEVLKKVCISKDGEYTIPFNMFEK